MADQMMTPQQRDSLRSEMMGYLIRGADIGLLAGLFAVAVAYLLGAGLDAFTNILIVFSCAGWCGLAVYGYELMRKFFAG